MTKSELVAAVSAITNKNKRVVREIIDAALEEIVAAAAKEDTVKIVNFGRFERVPTVPRKYTVPHGRGGETRTPFRLKFYSTLKADQAMSREDESV